MNGETASRAELEARDQIEEMENYITHMQDPGQQEMQQVGPDDYWRCFHCGEIFPASQEEQARRHFGALPPSRPTCWYGREEMEALLRAYEERNRLLLEEIGRLVQEHEAE